MSGEGPPEGGSPKGENLPTGVMLDATSVGVSGVGRDGSLMMTVQVVIPAGTLLVQKGITLLPPQQMQRALASDPAMRARPVVYFPFPPDALVASPKGGDGGDNGTPPSGGDRVGEAAPVRLVAKK